MTGGRTSLTLTAVEWLYLAALQGADALVGVPDPFAGWLAEEIEEALRSARSDLEARGWVSVAPDGRVTPAGEIAPLLGACAAPRRTIVFTRQAGGGACQQCFHVSESLAVEQSVDGASGAVTLTALTGAEGVLERLGEAFPGLEEEARGDAASLPAALFAEAREAAGKSDMPGAVAALARGGVAPVAADALAAALAAPQAEGALLVLAPGSSEAPDWTVDGVGYLIAAQGQWLIRRVQIDGEPVVELTPAGREDLFNALRRLLDQKAVGV